MTRKHYSDETKAAVMAALLAGQSVSSASKEYNIPKGTLSGWKHKAQGVAILTTQKENSIGGKLIELVSVKIDTLTKQYKVVADPEWIKKQSAADMAVLMGVSTDKLMRMLEAFGRSDNASDNAADD